MVQVEGHLFGTFPSSAPRVGRRNHVVRALVAATALCLLCLVAMASYQSSTDITLESSLSSNEFNTEAQTLEEKAQEHQRNAATLLKEYKALEASLSHASAATSLRVSKNVNKGAAKEQGVKKMVVHAGAVLADASGSGAAAAAASSGSAAVAASAGGSASAGAVAASGSAAAAAAAAGSGSNGAVGASGSEDKKKLVLPRYEDDKVHTVQEGEDPVPQGSVDLADPRAQEEDAAEGAFNSDNSFATAGDEFLTVKDLVKKVQDRSQANYNDLAEAKSKFADDTFVYSGSSKLKQPLAGWLGGNIQRGVVVNADGPAQPSHLSGNGFRDLFVPVGSQEQGSASSASSGSDSSATSGSASAGSGAASSGSAGASSGSGGASASGSGSSA